MRELLYILLMVLCIYLYKNLYDIEGNMHDLINENIKIKTELNNLKKELSQWQIRQVNWYGQYEEQSITNKVNYYSNEIVEVLEKD